MKNIQKFGLLIAVILATGGAGIWSQLQAVPPTTIVAKGIDVESNEVSAFLRENGDGTAFVFAGALLDDGTQLNAFSFATAAYSISNNLQPGQSGHGSFSGAGHVSLDGQIFDPSTGTSTPVVVSIDCTVTGADNAGAFIQQGVNPVQDPVTGETHILRQHTVGNQAYGLTAGSVSISADGVLVKQAAGQFGSVGTFRQHTIDRIR